MESVENPLKPLKYEENRLPRKLWIKKALSTAFLWIAIYPQPVPCVFHRKPVDNKTKNNSAFCTLHYALNFVLTV